MKQIFIMKDIKRNFKRGLINHYQYEECISQTLFCKGLNELSEIERGEVWYYAWDFNFDGYNENTINKVVDESREYMRRKRLSKLRGCNHG